MNSEAGADTNKKQKIGRIVAIIVAVIVIAALSIGSMRKKAVAPEVVSQIPDGCKPGYLFSETTGIPCPQQEPTVVPTVERTQSTYQEAANAYVGKMIVVGQSCTLGAIPGSIKSGTRIMIANDAVTPVTITINGRTQTLEGNHYFTTALKTTGPVPVSCDGKEILVLAVQ